MKSKKCLLGNLLAFKFLWWEKKRQSFQPSIPANHHKHDNFKGKIAYKKLFYAILSFTCSKCGTFFCIVVLIRSIWASYHAQWYFKAPTYLLLPTPLYPHTAPFATNFCFPSSASLFDASASQKPRLLWLITETRAL